MAQNTTEQLLQQQEDIAVYQAGDYRYFKFCDAGQPGEAIQSRIMLSQPHILVEPYFRRLAAALIFDPAPAKITLLGVGGGALIHFLRHYFEQTKLIAVEKESSVLHMAQHYFELPPPDNKLTIELEDAFEYLSLQPKAVNKTDLLLVDIYTSDNVDSGVFSENFLWDCYTLLDKEGVLAINYLQSDQQQAEQDLAQLKSIFSGGVLIIPVPDRLNLVVIAFKHTPVDLRYSTLLPNAQLLQQKLSLPFVAWLDELFNLYPHDSLINEKALKLS